MMAGTLTVDQTIDGVVSERIIGSSRKLLDDWHAAVEGGLAADVGARVVVCAFGGMDCGCQSLWRGAAGHKAIESK